MPSKAKHPVTIRALHQDDRSHWESLFRNYAAFYNTGLNANIEAIVWEWIFDEHNDFWCDLALDDSGTIIGFAHYQLMHRSLGGSMVCYLSDLFVNPRSRGNGVGRALIDHVLAFAKAQGLPDVRWYTQEFNYPGRTLYDTYAKKSDFIVYVVPAK